MGFSGSKTQFLNSIIYLISFSNKKSNSKKILTKLSFFKNNYWKIISNEFDKFKTRFLNSIIYLISFSNKKSNSKKVSTKLSFFKNNYWKTVPNEFDKFKISIYSQSRSQPYLLLDSQNRAKPHRDLYN
jgi:hypothetical protein